MRFFKNLGVSSKKTQAAKGFQPKKVSQQTFILEPLITPSGLVDSVDHSPHPLEIDLHTTILPEVDLPDFDTDHIDHAVSYTFDNDLISDIHHPVEQTTYGTMLDELNLHNAVHDQIIATHIVETPLADHQLEALPFLHSTSIDTQNTIDSTFNSGVFTVGDSGKVSIDYLFDGGQYQGELAIFNLDGMEQYQPGSHEFIQEAASRALSNSNFGHIVMSDAAEGARFSGLMGGELQDWNTGEYQGVNTFTMDKGSTFGIMLVPNGTVQEVLDGNTSGELHPLFSMSTANPNDAFHLGQIADVTNNGHTFVMEDLRVDSVSDHDYNDLVFQVRGATGTAIHLDDVIDHSQDWRTTDMGQALIDYAKPYDHPTDVTTVTPEAVNEISTSPITDNWSIDTDHITDNFNIVSNPIDEGSAITPETQEPVHFEFPKENQPLVGVVEIDSSTNNSDLEIIGEINNNVPLWEDQTSDPNFWAQSLTEFVDAAKESGQPNAIFNLSLNLTEINEDGVITPRFELSSQEREALVHAQLNNVLIVVPVGDNSEVVSALGQASSEFDNIITVGASERVNDSVALSESYDRADYSGYGFTLDIMADGNKGETSGISVAAAKVSGAASQVWAANPDLSYRQVIDILQRTATDLKTPNWDLDTGAGLLNIAAAVHLAKVTRPIDVDVPIRFNFAKADQPLVGVIDTGFNGKNPDIDYSRVTLGRDRVDNDTNPLLEDSKGSEHGTHVLGIIAAIQGNGIGIDGMNDDAPLWLGRAIGSGKWAESLREFVDAAKVSGQPNAVVNLSFDLTQTNPDGSVTTRYELTPQEREALEYARQNGVMVVVAAGNDGGTMSALGQASQEFDNIITIGSINNNGDRADYSSFGYGLDFVARGGTPDEQVISTVGEGIALKLLTSDEEPPEDEMSANARTTFEEVFGPFSNAEDSETDEQQLENLTPEERQVYDEATKEIDLLLNDYLSAASQKIALEYVDGYYAASVDALSRFVDAFDGDLADNLIKAQEILQEAGFKTDTPTERNLDFSIPLDLGIGEMAGTSVAAAKVTGAVSQVWAANPGLSYPQVKEILKQTAVDLNTPGWDLETGSGLVNVSAAVELAKRTKPQAYQPIPIQSPLTWSGEGKITPGERAVNISVPAFTGRLLNAGYVSTVGFLRIRSGPGTNYAEVGRISPGAAITFEAYTNDGGWVPDPYMPGGGSSRWYRIAGTNNWMSALYIDNTPEQAEQERQRQDAIRRAEEEARRAEEEVRRAEDEARRAEEELRRIEEEARRQAEAEQRRKEQLQAAVSQISQKIGDLGAQLGGYISNGLAVYQFAKGTLLVQPDGRSAFYEAGKKVAEFLDPNNQSTPIGYVKDKFINSDWTKNGLEWSAFVLDLDPVKELLSNWGEKLSYKAVSPGPNGFVLPRFGNFSNYVDESFSFLSKTADDWDNFLAFKAVNPGTNGFVLPRFGSTTWSKYARNTGPLGAVLGLAPLAYEYFNTSDSTKKREVLVKGGVETAFTMLGGSVGAVFGGPVGAVAGGLVGGYLGSLAGGWVNENWDTTLKPLTKPLEDGFNAVSSFTNSALEAAKEKAKAAADKAKELADKAKAAYQTATATVQQAKASYQTFKTEVQKATTQIVQQSQQKIKEEAQKIYNKIIQNPVVQAGSKVVKQVANYATKAVQAAGNIINGAKQFVSNIIDTGKQFVDNVIETGKKAYQEVKDFVVNTYETGKKVATETYNKAVEPFNNVTNTISNGFNSAKSFFKFGW